MTMVALDFEKEGDFEVQDCNLIGPCEVLAHTCSNPRVSHRKIRQAESKVCGGAR